MPTKKYTKAQFIDYVQGMISQEENSISIQMDIISRSGFAPDVVDRADKVRNYVTAKHTLERLIKYINSDWE